MIEATSKNLFKIGEMLIDPKQIFWKRQYIFACIPVIQLLPGHILIAPRRRVYDYKELEPAEVFDLSLAVKLLSRAMEEIFSSNSTTIFIQDQNSTKEQNKLGHMIVHVIPRKAGDKSNNDGIYAELQTYPEDLLKQYNTKINSFGNAYVNKILQGLHEEAKKYEQCLNAAYKKQQEISP